jgi:hypothetical protein
LLRERGKREPNRDCAEKLKVAQTERQRIELWTSLLEREDKTIILRWLKVFSAGLNLRRLFPERGLEERDEREKLLRKRLQRYFTMKCILTVDVVFVRCSHLFSLK